MFITLKPARGCRACIVIKLDIVRKLQGPHGDRIYRALKWPAQIGISAPRLYMATRLLACPLPPRSRPPSPCLLDLFFALCVVGAPSPSVGVVGVAWDEKR